eukprot:Gb_29016 [translate_table: standard]
MKDQISMLDKGLAMLTYLCGVFLLYHCTNMNVCTSGRSILVFDFFVWALLHSSHMFHEAKHSFSIHGIEGLFKKNKVNYDKGAGKIISTSEVSVELSGEGSSTVKGKHIIIATGSDVKALPGITIDEKKIVSSIGGLSLTGVPKKLIVIGAGYIGLEMGSIWGRLA